MTDNGKLYYKTCRENAGLTQEEACYHLNIAEATTLSKYENGHLKVLDDMAEAMALLYRAKKLIPWHIRHCHPRFVAYLPDITEPKCDGDMAFDIVLSKDDMIDLENLVKKFLRDGVLDESETEQLKAHSPKIKQTIDRLTSVAAYIDEKE